MHGVEMAGARDGLADPPLSAHVAQRPTGRAGLSLGTRVHGLLDTTPEQHERGEQSEDDADRDEQPRATEHETENDEHRDDQQEDADHVRDEPLVFFTLHLERLPELRVTLARGLTTSLFRRGLFLFACCRRLCHAL